MKFKDDADDEAEEFASETRLNDNVKEVDNEEMIVIMSSSSTFLTSQQFS
jgi:hypothetical protein